MIPTMIPMVADVCSLYESTLELVVGVEDVKALVSVVLYTVLVNDVASYKRHKVSADWTATEP